MAPIGASRTVINSNKVVPEGILVFTTTTTPNSIDYTIPAGVNKISVLLYGAGGGSADNGGNSNFYGGYASGINYSSPNGFVGLIAYGGGAGTPTTGGAGGGYFVTAYNSASAVGFFGGFGGNTSQAGGPGQTSVGPGFAAGGGIPGYNQAGGNAGSQISGAGGGGGGYWNNPDGFGIEYPASGGGGAFVPGLNLATAGGSSGGAGFAGGNGGYPGGGGGGVGWNNANRQAGGGGGGVIYLNDIATIPNTPITVTVGNGRGGSTSGANGLVIIMYGKNVKFDVAGSILPNVTPKYI